MNILFISHNDDLYGSSKSLLNLLDGIKRYQINPTLIISKEGKLHNELKERGINHYILPVVWWVAYKNHSNYVFKKSLVDLCKSISPINSTIKKNNIHLIYSNSSIFPIGRIVAFINRLPHIWHVREFGDLDYDLHFNFPKFISNKFILSSDAVICNSLAVKKYHFPNNNNSKVHVIHNGVFSEDQYLMMHSRPQNSEDDHVYTFLIVGYISPKKGQEIAIRAISTLINKGFKVKLLIIGNGIKEYEGYLKNLVIDLNISLFVNFIGYVPNPFNYYFSSDCLLMCSEHEAFGRVTVEAMSAKLPVIGKNSGGTPEIIEHQKSGFLYDTFEELIDAMIKLINNPKLGEYLGNNGWLLVKERFSIEEYSENIVKVINQCMNGHVAERSLM